MDIEFTEIHADSTHIYTQTDFWWISQYSGVRLCGRIHHYSRLCYHSLMDLVEIRNGSYYPATHQRRGVSYSGYS